MIVWFLFAFNRANKLQKYKKILDLRLKPALLTYNYEDFFHQTYVASFTASDASCGIGAVLRDRR